MAGKLIAGVVMLFALAAVACGSDDDKGRSGCCRIQHVCGTCDCQASWKAVGDAGDEDACDELLKNRDVGNGCSVYDGDDAIRACS
jgi:hypothetical protein